MSDCIKTGTGSREQKFPQFLNGSLKDQQWVVEKLEFHRTQLLVD
ncbi:hypothetical protein [Moorena sp. SIO1G6]|nr:hypothetical protein [Moorena sp. SIO1G6]